MVFRRNRSQLRPINSIKNIVQDVDLLATGATLTKIIATSVDTSVLANTTEVDRGSRINTVYIEIYIYGNTTTGTNSPMTWFVMKNPSTEIAVPNPALLGTTDRKKFVFAMGRGLSGSSTTGSPPYVIRGWFSIPKRYRRMGQNDTLNWSIRNDSGANLNICSMFLYKWYK